MDFGDSRTYIHPRLSSKVTLLHWRAIYYMAIIDCTSDYCLNKSEKGEGCVPDSDVHY